MTQLTEVGPFLPTTRIFPRDLQDLEFVLNKMYTDIAFAVNARVMGTYNHIQVLTGELWYNDQNIRRQRQSFRKVFTLPAIAAGATGTITHEISDLVAITHLYGACTTAAPDYRPIPYASVTLVTQQIEIRADNTSIYVTNGAGAPNIDSGSIVIEYLLNEDTT